MATEPDCRFPGWRVGWFGGKNTARAKLFTSPLAGAHGALQLGRGTRSSVRPSDKPCRFGQAPYGANMAFRKQMFEEYGLFRTDFSPSPRTGKFRAPTRTPSSVAVCWLRASDYATNPQLSHITQLQMAGIRKEYFLDWHFDWGRALVHESGAADKTFSGFRDHTSIWFR